MSASDHIVSIALGSAAITLLDVGRLDVGPLRQHLDLAGLSPNVREAAHLDRSVVLPMYCIHVAYASASVLVDAGFDDASPSSPFQPPESERTLDLVAGLALVGVRPEHVSHVVITHAHGDHFAGVTVERGGRYEPRFPNARCYLGVGDWDEVRTRAQEDPDSLEARTLGRLDQGGMLVPVAEDLDVAPGIRIVVTGGESPGHLIVRVSSEDQVAYCLGDLYHDTIEVEQPGWMFRDRNRAAMLAARRRLVEAALVENALLVASHIPGIGRLSRAGGGVAWTPVSAR